MNRLFLAFLAGCLCTSIAVISWNMFKTSSYTPQSTPDTISQNPKGTGYQTLSKEYNQLILPIKGSVPSWLSGTLFRNGPSQFELAGTSFLNWFDGFAMIHRFAIHKGIITYSNKFLKSSYYLDAIKNGKLPAMVGNQKKSFFSKLSGLFGNAPEYDNTNVNITKIGKTYVALTETPHALCFDDTSLKTIGRLKYADKLTGHVSTGHPFIDPKTKEQINILIEYGTISQVSVYCIAPDSTKRTVIASWQENQPSYIHSFAVSEKFIIIPQIPFTVKPLDLAFSSKPYIKNFSWHAKENTIFVVINRATKKIVGRFKSKPFFFFHTINAFDEGDTVSLDLITYKNADIVDSMLLQELKTGKPKKEYSNATRFTINLKTGIVTDQVIFSNSIELATSNPHLNGKKYQFAYSLDNDDTKIMKIDTLHGKIVTWSKPYNYPSEPLFIPRPRSHKEDDGVILSVVYDAQNKQSFLLILDAQSLKELARAELAHHIPFGFHGIFVPN